MPASPKDSVRDLWAKILSAFATRYGRTAVVRPTDGKRHLMVKTLQQIEQG